MPIQLLQDAQALQERTVALRREIHRHPELGLDLPRTRATVLESLQGLDLELALSATTSAPNPPGRISPPLSRSAFGIFRLTTLLVHENKKLIDIIINLMFMV